MKKKYKTLIILLAIFLLGFTYIKLRGSHTYTLTDLEHEQIKPIFGTVRVWGTVDTDVTFIDVENPEKKYLIGYITPGMSETIKLERGSWYKVKAGGDLTVTMVDVMIADTD